MKTLRPVPILLEISKRPNGHLGLCRVSRWLPASFGIEWQPPNSSRFWISEGPLRKVLFALSFRTSIEGGKGMFDTVWICACPVVLG